MQDNGLKHTSHHAEAFFAEKRINSWKTPPKSPDANPIENLWHELKVRVGVHLSVHIYMHIQYVSKK